jgi:hypothetical protein
VITQIAAVRWPLAMVVVAMAVAIVSVLAITLTTFFCATTSPMPLNPADHACKLA